MKTSTDIADAKVIRFNPENDAVEFTHGGTVHRVTRVEGYSVLRGGDYHTLTCSCGEDLGKTERSGGWAITQTDLVKSHAESLIRQTRIARNTARIQAVAAKVAGSLAVRLDIQLLAAQAQKAFDAAQRAEARYVEEAKREGVSDYRMGRLEQDGMKALAVLDFAMETLWLAVEDNDAPVLAGQDFRDALIAADVLAPLYPSFA